MGLGNSSTYLGISGSDLTFTDGSGIGTKTLSELASGGLWNPSGSDIFFDTGKVGIGTTPTATDFKLTLDNDGGIIALFDNLRFPSR